MLHTFVAYVEDLPGVLTRVASLFRRLNINIISLTVGRSERVGLSRMTVVADASAEAGHRIRASLFKLENVVYNFSLGLSRLLENDTWKIAGERGHQFIKKYCNTPVVIDNHIKMYKELVEK